MLPPNTRAPGTHMTTNKGAAKDWLKGGSQGKFGPEGSRPGGGPKNPSSGPDGGEIYQGEERRGIYMTQTPHQHLYTPEQPCPWTGAACCCALHVVRSSCFASSVWCVTIQSPPNYRPDCDGINHFEPTALSVPPPNARVFAA